MIYSLFFMIYDLYTEKQNNYSADKKRFTMCHTEVRAKKVTFPMDATTLLLTCHWKRSFLKRRSFPTSEEEIYDEV